MDIFLVLRRSGRGDRSSPGYRARKSARDGGEARRLQARSREPNHPRHRNGPERWESRLVSPKENRRLSACKDNLPRIIA
ncbi:hypothetical protein PUN28_001403 [Cardiocondyla obscurior]|uniref:Uncharacterized protein n=1 Tax=Cardiocondyla obscurior TaxID=286306 RepID=A0AAW2H4T9_9HYME